MSRSLNAPTRWVDGRTALRAGLFVALMFLVSASSMLRAAYAQAPQLVQHVVITLNKSINLPTSRPISSVQVDAPEIATARAITDRDIYIQAKSIGTTSVSIYDQNLQLMKLVEIEVALDTSNLQSKIRAATGNSGIRVANDNGQIVLSGTVSDAQTADRAYNLATAWARVCGQRVGGAYIAGGPGTQGGPPTNQTQIYNAPVSSVVPAAPPGGSVVGGCTVVNMMTVASPQQVMLKVRFLEVDRNAGRQLGINLNGTSPPGSGNGFSTGQGGLTCSPPCVQQPAGSLQTPTGNLFQTAGTLVGTSVGAPFGTILAQVVNKGVSINALITALETKGLLQRLAEPNLIALSGDTASFRVGGEYPMPTVQPGSSGTVPIITTQLTPYGIQLNFRPTVLNTGIINLSINPIVSELDYTNSVQISGTTIPSIADRTATTTVELRDGQSFAIAGLLQADNQRNISQFPWLGTVPVLGTLFRSSSYQKDQTDLVIIVTPSLVQPAAPGARLATPFDNTVPSNDVDFFLLGQTEERKKYTDYVASGGDLKGPYGYMLGVMQEPDPPAPQK